MRLDPEFLCRMLSAFKHSARLFVRIPAPLRWERRIVLWMIIGAALGIVWGVLFPIINSKLTAWVNSNRFREMLDHETSKGLKLEGSFSPLSRVELLGLKGDAFTGTNGAKTIVSLQADGIAGTFNPLGIAFRCWEIDNIHLKSGSVMLQKTKATVGIEGGSSSGSSSLPWWNFVWPQRIYLEDVKVDDAQILWHLRNQESGIYHTFLEIIPNGRDFEYDASGGEFKTPLTPQLELRHAHVLIRKPRLYCSDFLLGDDAAHPERGLRMEGDAGLQKDRSIKLKIDLNSLSISPWLPEKLRSHVTGQASGHLEYTSSDTGMETSQGHGTITIANATLHALPLVRHYIAVTGSPDPGDLALKVCEVDVGWKNGAIVAQNLNMECEGVFRLEGTITVAPDQSLIGELELGLTDPYLRWLPTARQTIFTRDEGPYHFATVNLSGTVKKPQQDLSTRFAKEVEKSPGLELKLFFNQAGEWFDFD